MIGHAWTAFWLSCAFIIVVDTSRHEASDRGHVRTKPREHFYGSVLTSKLVREDEDGIYNVRQPPFNATGNGIADDTSAIQDAIDIASKNGGRVYFPPGRYAIQRPLQVTGASGLTLVGSGISDSAGTIIIYNSTRSGTTQHLLSLSNSQYINIYDVVLAYTVADREMHWGLQPFEARSFAIAIQSSFWITIENLVIHDIPGAVLVNASNTVTITNVLVENVYGPSAFDIGANVGGRVDIVQLTRITTNNIAQGSNSNVTWLHIGQGTNTVRLNEVGFINGGIAVHMDSRFPANKDLGSGANYPLFLFANDLEIDFPLMDAIRLETGRVCNLVNCYVQGSKSGNGIRIMSSWAAEVQVSNSRISGHYQNGMLIDGGTQIIVNGNIIADNNRENNGQYSGIAISGSPNTFTITSNSIGAVAISGSQSVGAQMYGITFKTTEATSGTITGNVFTGNQKGGLNISDPFPASVVVGLNAGIGS